MLEVRWDIVSDEIVLGTEELASIVKQIKPSKRQVVCTVSCFYDPLGILSPVTLPFKVYFQKLSKIEVTWDQPFQGDLLKEWDELVTGLEDARLVHVPRCYQTLREPHGELQVQLYGFCDASLRAYAAVVYLVIEIEGERVPQLVCSKTRVAPLRELTIPRLELLSGLLLAQLIRTVTSSLETETQLASPQYFTDSKVSYFWITGCNKAWKPFVQNRVNEIRRVVPATQWHHYTGKDNPADLPSRGLTFAELIDSKLWFRGPQWLQELTMPEHIPPTEGLPQEYLIELKPSPNPTPVLFMAAQMNDVIRLEDYSNLNRLLRVSAYVLLFIQRVKGRETTLVDMMVRAEQYSSGL